MKFSLLVLFALIAIVFTQEQEQHPLVGLGSRWSKERKRVFIRAAFGEMERNINKKFGNYISQAPNDEFRRALIAQRNEAIDAAELGYNKAIYIVETQDDDSNDDDEASTQSAHPQGWRRRKIGRFVNRAATRIVRSPITSVAAGFVPGVGPALSAGLTAAQVAWDVADRVKAKKRREEEEEEEATLSLTERGVNAGKNVMNEIQQIHAVLGINTLDARPQGWRRRKFGNWVDRASREVAERAPAIIRFGRDVYDGVKGNNKRRRKEEEAQVESAHPQGWRRRKFGRFVDRTARKAKEGFQKALPVIKDVVTTAKTAHDLYRAARGGRSSSSRPSFGRQGGSRNLREEEEEAQVESAHPQGWRRRKVGRFVNRAASRVGRAAARVGRAIANNAGQIVAVGATAYDLYRAARGGRSSRPSFGRQRGSRNLREEEEAQVEGAHPQGWRRRKFGNWVDRTSRKVAERAPAIIRTVRTIARVGRVVAKVR